MRQIITLEKEIAFKTMVFDITSISLEHDLVFINDSEIEGNLLINGTYKMTEASTIEEEFEFKIPVEIMLSSKLLEDKRKLDINNFTYQIVNEEMLEIKVEVLIDGLEKIDIEDEKETLNEEEKEVNEVREEIEVLETNEVLENKELPSKEIIKQQEEQVKEEIVNNNATKEVMNSIFSAFANTEETYSTYSVYIIRDDDNLEDIINRYKITKEQLNEYNDLNNIKIGSKLIIPNAIEEVND